MEKSGGVWKPGYHALLPGGKISNCSGVHWHRRQARLSSGISVTRARSVRAEDGQKWRRKMTRSEDVEPSSPVTFRTVSYLLVWTSPGRTMQEIYPIRECSTDLAAGTLSWPWPSAPIIPSEGEADFSPRMLILAWGSEFQGLSGASTTASGCRRLPLEQTRSMVQYGLQHRNIQERSEVPESACAQKAHCGSEFYGPDPHGRFGIYFDRIAACNWLSRTNMPTLPGVGASFRRKRVSPKSPPWLHASGKGSLLGAKI
jgi:hypothetical protein